MSNNTTNYGWAYVHPTLGIGLTRGPERSITFQNSANADIDANGMGQASGSANLTFNSTTSVLALAGSAVITDSGTTVGLTVNQTGNGDVISAQDGGTQIFVVRENGNVGVGYATSTDVDKKLKVNGTGYFHSDLTVNGNLIVNGTTTTINSTTMTVDDPIITLGGDTAPGSDDNKDRGVEFRYHNGSAAKVGFFGYDDSSSRLVYIPDATNSSEVFTGAKGTLEAAGLTSTETSGLNLEATAGNVNIKATAADKDVIFTVKDGSAAAFTALTINGANAGSLVHTPADGGYAEFDDAGNDGKSRIYGNGLIQLYGYNDVGTNPKINFLRTRGNSSTKTKLTAGTSIGELNFYGYDTAEEAPAAAIVVKADAEHGTDSGSGADTTDSPGRIEFWTSDDGTSTLDNRMTIKHDGKIGIGTDSPTDLLTIQGAIDASIHLAADEDDEAYIDYSEQGGALATLGNSGVYGFRVGYDGADGKNYFVFKSAEAATITERMVIERQTGNVGIGLTDPGEKLEVNGTVKATALTIGSTTLSETEIAILDNANITTTELNVLDGDAGASNTTSPTIASADKLILNDDGVMTQVGMDNFETYFESALDTLPNVTSVGTLTSLSVTGDLTVDTSTLKVDSSNDRVGIGTSSPQAELHVWERAGEGNLASVDNPTVALFQRNNVNDEANITILGATAGTSAISFGDYQDEDVGKISYHHANNQLSFRVAGVGDRMVIDNAGNVGIGTSSPSQKLEIDSGHILLSNDYGVWFNDTQTGIQGRGDTDVLRLITGNVARMTVLAAGNVGIGKTNPSTKLDVAGTVTATAFAGNLTGNVTGNADTATTAGTVTTAAQPAITSVGALTSLTVQNGDLSVINSNDGTSKLFVDVSESNVGIGTASPSHNLHVKPSSGNARFVLESDNNAADVEMRLDCATSERNAYITFRTADTVVGGIGYVAGDGTTKMWGGNNHNDDHLCIASNGKVGIGVVDPDHKLEVDGAIHISGEMTTPATPADGDGGVLYAKTDGRLFWRSHEVDAEVSTGCTACSVYDMAIIDASSIGTPTTYNIGGGGGKTAGFQLSDYIIAVKTGASNNNNITIELPTPAGNAGKVFVIKDIAGQLGSGSQTIIISNAGVGTVEPNNTGAATLSSANAAISVFSDGSNWHIF